MPGKFQGMTVQEKMKQNNLEQHFTVHRNQVENHTNLTDLADGIIFSFFYFIQECQDTPEKKKKKKKRWCISIDIRLAVPGMANLLSHELSRLLSYKHFMMSVWLGSFGKHSRCY